MTLSEFDTILTIFFIYKVYPGSGSDIKVIPSQGDKVK